MRTVLVVDADLGFVVWLGDVLRGANYGAVPCADLGRAEEFSSEMHRLDLVIINAGFPSANDFIARLRERHSPPKVLAIVDGTAPPLLAGADAYICRANRLDCPNVRAHWLETIRACLSVDAVPRSMAAEEADAAVYRWASAATSSQFRR